MWAPGIIGGRQTHDRSTEVNPFVYLMFKKSRRVVDDRRNDDERHLAPDQTQLCGASVLFNRPADGVVSVNCDENRQPHCYRVKHQRRRPHEPVCSKNVNTTTVVTGRRYCNTESSFSDEKANSFLSCGAHAARCVSFAQTSRRSKNIPRQNYYYVIPKRWLLTR